MESKYSSNNAALIELIKNELKNGSKLEAIKTLKTHTSLGLKDSKEIIDDLSDGTLSYDQLDQRIESLPTVRKITSHKSNNNTLIKKSKPNTIYIYIIIFILIFIFFAFII